MRIKVLFSLHGWTISKNEDGNFDIRDHEGDVVDEATTLSVAIQSCKEQATESYRERLTEAIQNANTDDIAIDSLEAIVHLLGVDSATL